MSKTKKEHLQIELANPLPAEQRLKKSVGAIHSSGKLTLVQRKLANVLMYSAYDKLLSKRTHTIPVSIMCSMLGWDASNRIEHLKDALASLQETRLEFNLKEDGKEVWESMTMLSYAHIANGVCTYRYDEALAERLYDPAMFAMISLQVQRRIDSAHALNLYENCIRYKDTNTGSTGLWTLEVFREAIGGTAAYYDDFRKLNAKIIKPAIEKINDVSDIIISVEYEKKLRSVVGLKFQVREKTEEEKQTKPNPLPGMNFPESVDQYAELRNTEAFKALKAHGIAERLAFAWIREKGEAGVLELVAYTENKDQNKQIKSSTAAYMRSLVQTGAELGQTEYEKNKAQAKAQTQTTEALQAQQKHHDDLKASFTRTATNNALKALTKEQINTHANTYRESLGEAGKELRYDSNTSQFLEAIKQTQFSIWLRQTVAPAFDETTFKAWLKTQAQ